MPRRNENADYHRPGHEYRGKIYPIFLSTSESPSEHRYWKRAGRTLDADPAFRPLHPRSGSTIKTTGESIVRDHRNSVADLIRTPSVQRVYKAPWYRSVNWNRILNWGCWAALIACLVYLGIFFFWPFAVRIEWK